MKKLYVGIDISKETSTAHGIDGGANKRLSLFFEMDKAGFASLLRTIRDNCESISDVIVAMESTACYHINLYSFLISLGIETFVVNPLLIANFAKMSLRKTKTDKKDAETIARFLLAHKVSISQIDISQKLQDLRDIARERESLCHQISAVRVEIRRLLQTTFPELERLCNPFRKAILNMLKRYPSARLIRAARAGTVAKTLRQTMGSRKLTVSPKDIIEAAASSVASVSAAKELILQGKIETLEHLEKRKKKISAVLTEYCASSMIEDLEILTSIKGISNGTATTFLAEIGTIENFRSWKNLVAYAGLDPTVHQSGKFEGKSRISKRGNRHLRRVIWLMTGCVISQNRIYKEYFLKKKAEGQAPKKAMFATSHKLLRLIHAMLSQRTHFQERCI
jgi:transposase